MPDHFEKAKDDILYRTEGNGGPSTRDLLIALGALAEDVDEAMTTLDSRNNARHNESIEMLDAHVVEACVRDERITALERWRKEASEKCAERVAKIAEDVARSVHDPVHAAHMASHHEDTPDKREHDAAGEDHHNERKTGFPQGDDRTLFELVLGWSIIKWVIAGACMAAIVWGVSYWASSCATTIIEREIIELEQQQDLEQQEQEQDRLRNLYFSPSPSPSP